jgi:hypothetical protein
VLEAKDVVGSHMSRAGAKGPGGESSRKQRLPSWRSMRSVPGTVACLTSQKLSATGLMQRGSSTTERYLMFVFVNRPMYVLEA